jgi:DNA-binding NarL/FixJ family response regulator
MLTNREHISHVERALSLGATDYLFKDDAAAQLNTTVAQLLAQRAAGSC